MVAVATIVSASARRSISERANARGDPYVDGDFERFDDDRRYLVTTPGGVALAVREARPVEASVAMVFVYGFCLLMSSFHFQQKWFGERWGLLVLMVFYDHCDHSQSSEVTLDTYTLTQLGQDLRTVLQTVTLHGVIVLVGHSVGGILTSPALEAVRLTSRSTPNLMHRVSIVSQSPIGPIYSNLRVSRGLDAFSRRIMTDTLIAILAGFLRVRKLHDVTVGLWPLLRVSSLITCGDYDLLTSDERSRRIAALLLLSALGIVTGASRLALLDNPDAINDGLVRLVDRAVPGKAALRCRRFRERFQRHG
ncbi:alpha/beta hydrolase [Mycobacterium lepromatosis]|nr:alpha/beta hydrolase [Mycobacterium lepromatosis]